MESAYDQALAYILSLTDLERRTDLTGARAQLGLERMKVMLDAIGHPETAYWTVHVAGTKGKGSTAAMIERVLRATGMETGLYTSPHLHTFRERIRFCGRPIAPTALASLTAELRLCVDAMPDRPSTFELATTLALLYFARRRAHAAVLEVGLGGRLDATNVVTPRVAVITSISYDHMAILGNSLGQIAYEKAGIIKPGVPVVSSPQHPEALAVIERIARERGAPLTLVGRDMEVRITDASKNGVWATIVGAGYCHDVHVPLIGEHQATNAATAVAALEVLRQQGVPLTARQMTDGLSLVHWPGRLEILARRPTILVDGAHNVDSAQKLRAALDEFFPLEDQHRAWPAQSCTDAAQRRRRHFFRALRPRVLILGMSADKDIRGIMNVLVPGADAVIVTRSNHPRAADVELLKSAAAPFGCTLFTIPDVRGALVEARRLAGDDGLICASGSLFIVADVRALVKGVHQEVFMS